MAHSFGRTGLVLLALLGGLTGCQSRTPGPTPSPSPGTGGGWLHAISSSVVGSGTAVATIEYMTTFALDPATGAPSNPVDTALPTNFGGNGLAADPASSLLFVTGGGIGGATGRLLPIQVANGRLTLGTVFDMSSVSMGYVTPIEPVASSGILLACSTIETPGPVGGGPVLSYSYTPTGSLTLVQPATPPGFVVPQGGSPRSLALDPTGGFVFGPLPWASADSVAMFTNAAGALTPVSGSPFSFGSATRRLAVVAAVHTSGKFVFAANQDGSVTAFSNTAGVLSNPMTTASLIPASGWTTTPIALDPSGQFLFQAQGTQIVTFAIDQATGALTPTGPALQTPLGGGSSLVTDGNGHLYATVLLATGSTPAIGVQGFSIGANGALTPIGSGPVALPSGSNPFGLAFTR